MSRLIATLALLAGCIVPSRYELVHQVDAGGELLEVHQVDAGDEVLDGGELLEVHQVDSGEVLGGDGSCWVADLIGPRDVPEVPPDLWTVVVFCCWGRCSSYIVGNGAGCFPCGDYCRTGADQCSCSVCR